MPRRRDGRRAAFTWEQKYTLSMEPKSPRRYILGETFYLDTNVIDSRDEAAEFLRRLGHERWVELRRTDTMDTELMAASPEKRDVLLEQSAQYPQALSPFAFDHSRWDHSIWGSTEDSIRIKQVFAKLFPNVQYGPQTRRNHVRDALHVSTAIRYGGHAFVTNERRLLNKDAAISAAFNHFRILSPQDARDIVMKRVRTTRLRYKIQGISDELPSWPDERDLIERMLGEYQRMHGPGSL